MSGLLVGTRRTLLGVPSLPRNVLDTFTRADNALSLGKAESGHPWFVPGSNKYGISSNQAYLATASETHDRALIDAHLFDCTVTVTITWKTGSNIGLSFRDDGIVNFNGFMVRLSSSLGLFRTDAGSYTSIGNFGITPVDGTQYTIQVVLAGTSISVSLNGTLRIGPITAAQYATQTRHGLLSITNVAGCRWDDFSIV